MVSPQNGDTRGKPPPLATPLLRGFQRSNDPVDFFEFLSTEFAACSKPTSRDNDRKASYPRTQQRDQGAG